MPQQTARSTRSKPGWQAPAVDGREGGCVRLRRALRLQWKVGRCGGGQGVGRVAGQPRKRLPRQVVQVSRRISGSGWGRGDRLGGRGWRSRRRQVGSSLWNKSRVYKFQDRYIT